MPEPEIIQRENPFQPVEAIEEAIEPEGPQTLNTNMNNSDDDKFHEESPFVEDPKEVEKRKKFSRYFFSFLAIGFLIAIVLSVLRFTEGEKKDAFKVIENN